MGVQEKKRVLKELLESGKAKGKLTTKEISDALEELDYDVEQVDKMYDLLEANNIEIVEDMVTPVEEDLKDLKITDVITLEEFIEHHNHYVYEVYNETPHSGDAMFQQSPNHLYSTLPYTIRRVSKDVLYFSLMRVKGTRTVQRNGITFNKTHFYDDNCIRYIGQKVVAKYDPTRPAV